MKKIRLIIIEDNRLLREGINAILHKEPDINVVGAYDEADFIMDRLSEAKPDIVLLDLGLSKQNSFELVKSLKSKYNDVKVIVMDLVPIQEDILRFVEAGVSGFILKDASVNELTNTIRSVNNGEKVLPSILTGSLFSQILEYGVKELSPAILVQSVRMTKREREIVELISEGLANK